MFQTLADMATMRALLEAAERESAAMGEVDPGAEHVVKAALALPDRTAADALAELGVDAAQLRAAIEQVHAEALAAVGIPEPPTPTPLEVTGARDLAWSETPRDSSWPLRPWTGDGSARWRSQSSGRPHRLDVRPARCLRAVRPGSRAHPARARVRLASGTTACVVGHRRRHRPRPSTNQRRGRRMAAHHRRPGLPAPVDASSASGIERTAASV